MFLQIVTEHHSHHFWINMIIVTLLIFNALVFIDYRASRDKWKEYMDEMNKQESELEMNPCMRRQRGLKVKQNNSSLDGDGLTRRL